MFSRLLATGAVVQPFETSLALGSYWLTRLQSRSLTPAMAAFSAWLVATVAEEGLG
jgi:LysR family transcriptional regulator of beta-lactamase